MKKTRPKRIPRWAHYYGTSQRTIQRIHLANVRAPEVVFLAPKAHRGRDRAHPPKWGARAREQRDRRDA